MTCILFISKSFASCKNSLDAASPGSVTIVDEREQAFCEVLDSLGILKFKKKSYILEEVK